MQYAITREQAFTNLNNHLLQLNEAMVKCQVKMLEAEHLPAETLRETYNKMLQYGQAITWLTNIAHTQFKDLIPKNGQEPSKIITADN